MRKYGILLFQVCVIFVLLLAGCFKGEQDLSEMDVPEEYVEKEVEDTDREEGNEEIITIEETVERQLYLIDADGMVVPQTLPLPKIESKAVATQVLHYLVKDGPVTEILPNGFQAVIPAGTEILGLNLLEDGTLIVDVSDEFKAYDASDELKIIEAMTHTLTQFDNVKQIKLLINGVSQSTMPVNGTPISEGYSKSNGINIQVEEQPDLQYSKVVTMFYPKEYNGNAYYVPVTEYVHDKDDQKYHLMVQALLSGPIADIETINVFNDGTLLVSKPDLVDGVLQLEFNEQILKDKTDTIIADEVVETLARNFSYEEDIHAIEVLVENKPTVKNENGEVYTVPVSVDSSNPMNI